MNKNRLLNFLSLIIRPIYNKEIIRLFDGLSRTLKWSVYKSSLKSVGVNSWVDKDFVLRGARYIEIGDGFCAGRGMLLEAYDSYGDASACWEPRIEIGDNVTFTDYDHISCIDYVKIGDGALLGHNVYISDNSHGDSSVEMLNVPPIQRPLTSKGPVIIGKNVWIGRCVAILSGVTIGDNVIIGANSVVNKNVPANCVVAGNPAKIVKTITM